MSPKAPIPKPRPLARRIARALLITLAILLLLTGAGIAAAWAPDRSVESLRARWAPAPSVFVRVAGMSVHLRDEGPHDDPTPIVLLHGTSASLHTWEGWVRALATHRRVITFDLPGFGLTGPDPQRDYHIEHYVQFVLSMLDERGVSHCVLAGNSFGGTIAWETAARAPERIERLILVDAGGYASTPRSLPLGFRLARSPATSWLAPHLLTRSLIARSVRDVYGDPSRVTNDLIERYYELTLREGNRAAVVQRFEQVRAGEHESRIASVRTPTLILWGGRDRLIPVENAERFHRDIAGSQLVIFPMLGHVPHEEDPAATVAAVERFLAQ